MKRDIANYMSRCLVCQKVKVEHQRPGGLLQPLSIQVQKWDQIIMDFIVELPRTSRHHDTIWVIMDRLAKSSHFLAVKVIFTAEQLVELYLKEVVQLHGILLSVILDRDTKFVSKFWHRFQQAMGTELCLSMTFHPQTDGQSKRTIQTLERSVMSLRSRLCWKLGSEPTFGRVFL